MRDLVDAIETFGKKTLRDRASAIRSILWLALCVAALNLSAAAFQAGLDPTFGDVGKVVTSPDVTPTFSTVAMAVQPDGKIVIAGNRVSTTSSFAGMYVARFNPDGTLDTGFGTNFGWSPIAFGPNLEMAKAVSLQSDGKIVLGGTTRTNEGDPNMSVARLDSNGMLDTSFDTDGKAIIPFNDLLPAYVESLGTLEIGSDGKIVIAGTAVLTTTNDKFILARLNTDGSLDSGFGTGGKFVDTGSISNLDVIHDMVIMPDGKPVIVGELHPPNGNFRIVIKYNINGTREWTYAQGQSFIGEFEAYTGIERAPDGKFIVVGKRVNRVVAMRINENGIEDNTFITPAGMPIGRALSVAIQSDGKIVAAIEGNTFQLVRFNADGSLDTGFGSGGFVNTVVSGGQDHATEVLIQQDGKILAGGTSQFGSPTGNYISMVRYRGSFAFPDNRSFDYDGDGRSDVSVFRPSTGFWYLNQSTDGISSVPFGVSTDKIAPADYDGDARTDIAIYRDGSWWILQSSNGVVINRQFGIVGDKPQSGDFDKDGMDDLVVFRPSNNTWYVVKSADGGSITTVFGVAGDLPLSADYDGDGKTDPAIYRPSTGAWWYAASSAAGQHRTTSWGLAADRPAPADYDGDGKTDFAVYRPADGLWFILNSGGASPTITNFGLAEDRPVPADYDGDGKADIAVFRPSTGIWYMLQSTAGFTGVNWGVSTDVPTQAAFTP